MRPKAGLRHPQVGMVEVQDAKGEGLAPLQKRREDKSGQRAGRLKVVTMAMVTNNSYVAKRL